MSRDRTVERKKVKPQRLKSATQELLGVAPPCKHDENVPIWRVGDVDQDGELNTYWPASVLLEGKKKQFYFSAQEAKNTSNVTS